MKDEAMHEEIFKTHPLYLCKVSNKGTILYLDDTPARLINSRYISCHICDSTGKSFPKLVHRLVAETFIGEIPEKMQVNHKDGNRHNNELDNLEIVTPSQNLKHAHENNLVSVRKGEKHPKAKLTEKFVLQIYEDFKLGIQDSIIADKYQISFKLVSLLRRGKRWKHLFYFHFKAPLPSVRLKEVTLEQAIKLISLLPSRSNSELATMFNLDRSSIYRIRNRLTWKNVWYYYDNIDVQRLSQ
jgi:hypothetical protein